MNTKKSSKMEKSPKSTREEAILPNLPMQLITIRSNHIRSRGQTYLGIAKSWLTTSRRCNNNKQPQNPQLALLTDTARCMWKDYWDTSLVRPLHWCSSPPPGYPGNFFKLSRSYSYTIVFPGGNKCRPPSTTLTLILTNVSVPAVVVNSLTYIGGTYKSQWMKYENTTIDPYDADNKFMKFTNGVISCNGNIFYVLSSQGCLVVMEKANEEQLTIKGICRTRAVPSINAKYFKEYMFASKGEIFLVFLIYRKSDVAVGVEVYRVDHVGTTTFDLVKIDRLDGRVLFLDRECCLWVDGEELGCKGDCVYFTGGLSGENGWWMFDMENKSISAAWNKRTRINGHGVSITEYEPVLLGL